MKLWNFIFGGSDTEQPEPMPSLDLGINPANGLPLIQGTTIDVEGNPYGTDSHTWDGIGTDFDCNNLSNFE